MPDQIKRLLIAFVVFVALFLVIRTLLIPKSFGKFGHYRADAIDEQALLPLRYAGRKACLKCHENMVNEVANGFHSSLSCEGCHGPSYRHAIFSGQADTASLPDSLRVTRPSGRAYCARCHDQNAARFKLIADSSGLVKVKMIVEQEHNHFINPETNEIIHCAECHYPHSP
jgi:hypothetical protein